MGENLEFERRIDKVTICRLTGQFLEARRLLSSLSQVSHQEMSTFQKNMIAFEKGELLADLHYNKRAETVLRKAIRVSLITSNPPDAMTSWSHSLLVAKI